VRLAPFNVPSEWELLGCAALCHGLLTPQHDLEPLAPAWGLEGEPACAERSPASPPAPPLARLLNEYDVMLDGILLKPNMCLPGLDAPVATPKEVA